MPRLSFNAKSDYVAKPLSAAGTLRARQRGRVAGPAAGRRVLFDSYGGQLNRVAPTATAFVHRNELFCIQYFGDAERAGWISHVWQAMRRLRLRPGLPELHRPDPEGLAAGLLRQRLTRLESDPPTGRPPPLLQFPAGDRALRSGSRQLEQAGVPRRIVRGGTTHGVRFERERLTYVARIARTKIPCAVGSTAVSRTVIVYGTTSPVG